MEFLIEKKVNEFMLVTYSAYVEADSMVEALVKVEADSDEIDWTEDSNEVLDMQVKLIHEKTY